MKNKSQTNQINNQEKKYTSSKNSKDNLTENKINDGINLDYDYNTEYGDGDIPDIDK